MILLMRHGETDYNREPARVQGHIDVPLNSTGRRQARGQARRLAAGRRPDSIHASHLSRARETATLIGEHLGLVPSFDERLAESDRGRWEGQAWEAIARAEPEAYAAWRAAGEGFRFPEGESLGEQTARVIAALDEIAARAPRDALRLVVCHGGSIRVALCHARGRGLEDFHEWDVPNGALIEL